MLSFRKPAQRPTPVMSTYFIGYDLGSSSLKTALVAADSGEVVALVKTPSEEMEIQAPRAGWAEQDPGLWWDCVCQGTREILRRSGISKDAIRGIGIAYQMHGLVPLDSGGKVVRPSIIWCDSRAVPTGLAAARDLGENLCRSRLLNEPGNFTGSRLRWMQQHEPELFQKNPYHSLAGRLHSLQADGKTANDCQRTFRRNPLGFFKKRTRALAAGALGNGP